MADTDMTSAKTSAGAADDHYHHLICEQAGVALIGTDDDLNIRMWNAAAGSLFGAAAAQMLGASILTVVPAPLRAEVERSLRLALIERERSEFEFAERDVAGTPRRLAAVITPLIDDNGSVLGTLMSLADITTQARLLEESARNRKMAALGQMAGAMAHHFNNVLGGLVISVDFALGTENPAAEHRALEQTARSLARARRLVDHLLAFAEGDHRHGDLGDLTEVLLEVIESSEPELETAKVKLVLNVESGPVMAVPRPQIRTVVENLVRNAVEAMPIGGTLQVGLAFADGWYEIRFADTGCGIGEQAIDHIFEPFYSTKAAAGCEERAAGLGLAMVHGIVRELGGTVAVTSHVGKGAEFLVRIPFQPPLATT